MSIPLEKGPGAGAQSALDDEVKLGESPCDISEGLLVCYALSEKVMFEYA